MTIEEINKSYGVDLNAIQKNELESVIDDCNETIYIPELIQVINNIHNNYKYLQSANKLFEFNEFPFNPFKNNKNTFNYIYDINKFIEKIDFDINEEKSLYFVKINISFQESTKNEYKYIFCYYDLNDLKNYEQLKEKIINNHYEWSLKTIKEIKINKTMITDIKEVINILNECTIPENYIIDNSIKSLNKIEGIKCNDCFVFNHYNAFNKFME